MRSSSPVSSRPVSSGSLPTRMICRRIAPPSRTCRHSLVWRGSIASSGAAARFSASVHRDPSRVHLRCARRLQRFHQRRGSSEGRVRPLYGRSRLRPTVA
jgi:hypothetical protein